MKTRDGFVSNSSSSSFVIKLDDISASQLKKIMDHKSCGQLFAETDYWDIVVDDAHVMGETIMDNFDMRDFLEGIGVDMSKVQFYGDNY